MPIDPYGHEATAPPNSGSNPADIAAIASLVFGVLAVVFSCCCGLLSVPLAFLGLLAGGFGAYGGTGQNRLLAFGGIALNVVAMAVFALSFALGFGMQMLAALQNM